MKKLISVFFAVFLVFSLAAFPVYAAENAETGEETIEELFPKQAGDMLLENGFNSLDTKALTELSVEDAVKYIYNCVKREITTPFLLIYSIFLIIIVTVIASGMNGGFLNSELEKNFSMVGVLCVCTTAITPIITCLGETANFISELSGFVRVFVPSLTGVMLTAGQTTTGLGYQTVMLAASEFLSIFLSSIILPLLFLFLAFSVVGRVAAGAHLQSITSSVKSTVIWCLTLLMSLFVALVTIKGLVGAGADSIALRTGKFFVGSFVPAVGGALSEAAATVQKSMGLIKNTTGVFGIIAAAMYFIPPLIKVLVYKLTCEISASVGEMLGAAKISGLLRDIAGVLGLVSAVILSYGVLIILSTAITLMFGSGG